MLLFLFACASHGPEAVAAPASAPVSTPAEVATPVRTLALDPDAIVAATDRTEEDRALDAGRHPAELLRLLDLRPGDRVADLMAGGGYTTELLARAVGPTGVVYGQNTPFILQRFAEGPWSARLTRPAVHNVTRLDAELEDPLGDVRDLDAVTLVLFYHDAVWLKTDRSAMNAAIFRALRSGGHYLVVDHSAKPGTGVADAETLHRVEASVVTTEVQAAGFRLAKTADFLRNPADTMDWSTSPKNAGERRGTSDRFVLLFEKP